MRMNEGDSPNSSPRFMKRLWNYDLNLKFAQSINSNNYYNNNNENAHR